LHNRETTFPVTNSFTIITAALFGFYQGNYAPALQKERDISETPEAEQRELYRKAACE